MNHNRFSIDVGMVLGQRSHLYTAIKLESIFAGEQPSIRTSERLATTLGS